MAKFAVLKPAIWKGNAVYTCILNGTNLLNLSISDYVSHTSVCFGVEIASISGISTAVLL